MATANWNDVTQPDNHLQPEKSEFTPCKKDSGCSTTESVIQMQQKSCIEKNVSHAPYLDDPSCRMETTVCHLDHVPTKSGKTAQHKASENGFKKTERKSTNFILFVKELMTTKDRQIEELSGIFHRHQEEVEKLKMSEKPRDDIEVQIMEMRISHWRRKFFNHKSLMDHATSLLDGLMTRYNEQVSNLDEWKLQYQSCLDTFNRCKKYDEQDEINLETLSNRIQADMKTKNVSHAPYLDDPSCRMETTVCHLDHVPTKSGKTAQHKASENGFKKTERKSTNFILFVKELMTTKDRQIEELSGIFHRHQEEVEKLKMSEKPRDDIEVQIMEMRISHWRRKFFNHKSLMDHATSLLDGLMTRYNEQVSNLDEWKLQYQSCLDTFNRCKKYDEQDEINLETLSNRIQADMKTLTSRKKNEGMTVSATESRPIKRGQEGQYEQTENSLRLDIGVMSQIVSEVIPATRYQSIQQLRSEASGRSRLQENSDGGATLTQAEASQQNSPEHCPICLEPVNKKSFPNSCIHSFCFGCLKQWSKVKAECPLCRCLFTGIIHNIRADDSYNIFKV